MTKLPEELCRVTPGGNIGIGTTTPERLIHIKTTREDYKRMYTKRGRIGIFILRLIGVIKLEFNN